MIYQEAVLRATKYSLPDIEENWFGTTPII
jgi:hypothetical protein